MRKEDFGSPEDEFDRIVDDLGLDEEIDDFLE